MLTKPTKFSANYQNTASTQLIIVKLTDGSSTWYLSDTEIELTDGHVWGILDDISGMSASVDVFTRDWEAGNLTLTISNLPYKKNTSGEWVKFSDEIGSLVSQSVTVYLLAGSNTASLSDCMTYGSYYIYQQPSYDKDTVTVSAYVKGKKYNRLLPATRLGAIFSGAPAESYWEYIPLVYGTFDYDGTDPYAGNGMARGIPTTSGVLCEYIFSDHALGSISAMWSPRKNVLPFEHISPTLTADDSGYGTATGASFLVWGWYPVSTDTPSRFDYDMNYRPVTGLDFVDNGSTVIGEDIWNFSDEAENEIIQIAKLNEELGATLTAWKVYGGLSLGTGVTQDSGEIRLYYHAEETTENDAYMTTGTGTTVATGSGNTYEINNTSGYTIHCDDKNDRYVLSAYITDNSSTIADSVTNNSTVVTLGTDCILKIPTPLLSGEQFKPVYTSEIVDVSHAWCACTGREASATIGALSAHATTGTQLNTVDLIIMSLLLDECSVSSTEIDDDSFDDCYNQNTSHRMRLNQVKREYLFDIIKKLVEQSTCAFCWTPGSGAKLISLNDSTPTTDKTILWSHIVDGTLKVGKTAKQADKFVVKSRWLGEFNRYEDIDTLGSGTNVYEAEWPNINGATMDEVMTNYSAWWNANLGNITLETQGFSNSDLEVGDWIELDSTTVDPHIKYYGASWSGKQFLVVDIDQLKDSTRIYAIENGV